MTDPHHDSQDFNRESAGALVGGSPTIGEAGPIRVVIEAVDPEIDGGRFPIKRTEGERVIVEADIFTDGHDELACELHFRRNEEADFNLVPMKRLANDRWRGEFTVGRRGHYRYTIRARIDHFRTWRRDLAKRARAGQNLEIEFQVAAKLLENCEHRATRMDAEQLKSAANVLTGELSTEAKMNLATNDELARLVDRHADWTLAARYGWELRVVVDRPKAGFSAWYEMFPRSCAAEPGHHGTLRDCEARLPYVASMGFDVLYLPPIHPIGLNFRKGKNNAAEAMPPTAAVRGPLAISREATKRSCRNWAMSRISAA